MKHFYFVSSAVIGLMLGCPSLHAEESPSDVDYEVNVRFNIEQGAAGVCFAGHDSNNFVLYQFRSGESIMRPHSRVNDNWVESHNQSYPGGFVLEAGKYYTVRIVVSDNCQAAYTYITPDGGDEMMVYDMRDGRYHLQPGLVGVRQSYEGDKDDRAYFDYFTVKDGQGNLLYSEDFSDPSACSFTLPDAFKISDGLLYADGSHAEYFAWQKETVDETRNFTVECDFEINAVAAGIIWNAKDTDNFHMWQFNIERNPSQFRPHSWVNGGASANDIVVNEISANTLHHLLIEVINGGKTAVTYLDGKKIHETDGDFDINGKLGIRASYAESEINGERPSEDAFYDNFIVKDYEGNTVFSEDFSDPAHSYFPQGTVSDGRLHIVGPSNNEVRILATETPDNQLTTGIADIITDNGDTLVNIYNIQGMPLYINADAGCVNALPAGLYIINGKKVLVK